MNCVSGLATHVRYLRAKNISVPYVVQDKTQLKMGPKTRKRPTAHEAFIDDKADDGVDNLPLSDEERPRKSEKKVRAKDGQLGFYHKTSFDSRTNFTMEVKADIYSKAYQLKGLSEKISISISYMYCRKYFHCSFGYWRQSGNFCSREGLVLSWTVQGIQQLLPLQSYLGQ